MQSKERKDIYTNTVAVKDDIFLKLSVELHQGANNLWKMSYCYSCWPNGGGQNGSNYPQYI